MNFERELLLVSTCQSVDAGSKLVHFTFPELYRILALYFLVKKHSYL